MIDWLMSHSLGHTVENWRMIVVAFCFVIWFGAQCAGLWAIWKLSKIP